MSRVLLVVNAVVLVTGTIVTGAGPHSGGGNEDNVTRFDFEIPEVAPRPRHHGHAVPRAGARDAVADPARPGARERADAASRVLLVVLVAQAGVGYAQYFSDIPPLLVGIHIAGATAVWSATLVFALGCFGRTSPASAGLSPGEQSPTLLTRA